MTAINAYDSGDTSAASTSIDITQSACGSAGSTPTAEPFFDTLIGLTIVNDSSFSVNFQSLRFTVANFDGAGSTFRSGSLSLIGESNVDANGGQSTIFSLVFDANSGGKRFFGASSNISDRGFKNLTFTLTGVNESGDTVTVSGSTALSFDNFNHC